MTTLGPLNQSHTNSGCTHLKKRNFTITAVNVLLSWLTREKKVCFEKLNCEWTFVRPAGLQGLALGSVVSGAGLLIKETKRNIL